MIDPTALGLTVHSGHGNEVVVTCPYHDDDNPSASFNMVTGLFHCFTCGVGKTARQIAKDLDGELTDDPQPVKKLVMLTDPEIDWRTRFMTCGLAYENSYLNSRHVPRVAIEKLKIKACEAGIIFPLFSTIAGDISGVQVRQYHGSPKYIFYGKKPAIYPMIGLKSIKHFAILVEGVFSVIRGRSAGFDVFAVMGAMSLAPALKFFYDRTNVRGIFDPDEAGYIASAKLAAIGVECLKVPFEADERSIKDWKSIVSDRSNFSMDAGLFAKKAVSAGAKRGTVMEQILKFEKEHSNEKAL